MDDKKILVVKSMEQGAQLMRAEERKGRRLTEAEAVQEIGAQSGLFLPTRIARELAPKRAPKGRHQGSKEKARRLKQLERARAKERRRIDHDNQVNS